MAKLNRTYDSGGDRQPDGGIDGKDEGSGWQS